MTVLVGTMSCYMHDEFVISSENLDVVKTEIDHAISRYLAVPRVAAPSARITEFSYGAIRRSLFGFWNLDKGKIDWLPG